MEEGILGDRDWPTWKVFGLGGQWVGKARNAAEAKEKAMLAGVLVISWVRKELGRLDCRGGDSPPGLHPGARGVDVSNGRAHHHRGGSMIKITQICTGYDPTSEESVLYALASDGSLWVLGRNYRDDWESIHPPPLFQDDETCPECGHLDDIRGGEGCNADAKGGLPAQICPCKESRGNEGCSPIDRDHLGDLLDADGKWVG